jgi:hypothetical protein
MNANRQTVAKTAVLLSVGVAALALGSAVNGSATTPSAQGVVAKLKAKHGSGISGTATLTARGKGVRVVLRLSGPVRNNSPAHIHTGPCRREPTFANPRIHSSLNYVVEGKSVTTVTLMTLPRLRARSFSINVHDPGSYGVIACGDIPRAS